MEGLKKNYNKIISTKLAKKLLILLVIVLFFELFLFPMPVLADEAVEMAKISLEELEKSQMAEHLPEADLRVKSTNFHVITAYNSEAGQTDGTPCITANNFNVCEHGVEDTVAANFLPFGTKIRIPEAFGDKVFVVRDRMNARHSDRVDVWMLHKEDARKFGIQSVKVEILY